MEIIYLDREGDYDIVYHDTLISEFLRSILKKDLDSIRVFYTITKNTLTEILIRYDPVISEILESTNTILSRSSYTISEEGEGVLKITTSAYTSIDYSKSGLVILKDPNASGNRQFNKLLSKFSSDKLSVYDYLDEEEYIINVLRGCTANDIIPLVDHIRIVHSYNLDNGISIKGIIVLV